MFERSARLRLSAGLLLAISFLPFLSRFHYLPLPQWWGEISVVILAALGAILSPARILGIPRVGIWLVMLALVWALQPQLVAIMFPGMNYAVALSFLALGMLAIALASLREEIGEELLLVYLCWGLVIGALLQSLIGIIQWSGLVQSLGGLLFYDSAHPTSNIFGHIGQRNQYAHYLSWGMVAVAWLAAIGRLGRVMAIALLLWLGFSVAIAGSRTALLYIVIMLGVSAIWHWRFRENTTRQALLWLTLAALALFAMQFAQPLWQWLFADGGTHGASGIQRLAANSDGMGARRLAEWHKAWLSFVHAPLFGIGWSQFAAESVRLQLMPIFADSGVNSGLFTNSHNLALNLLAEMGAIGFAVFTLGLLWVLLPFFGKQAKPHHQLALLLLGISLTHSMLEYPLWYLYFPAVLTIALALAPGNPSVEVSSPRLLQGVAVLMLFLSVYGSVRYVNLQDLYQPRKPEEQQALLEIAGKESLFAFHAMAMLDDVVRPSAQTPPEQRQWIAQMVRMRPYPDVLRKEAQFLALEGKQHEAALTMQMALASFPTYAPFFSRALATSEPAWASLQLQVEHFRQTSGN